MPPDARATEAWGLSACPRLQGCWQVAAQPCHRGGGAGGSGPAFPPLVHELKGTGGGRRGEPGAQSECP